MSYFVLVKNYSELVQLKLNIETSVGDSTPTEAGYGGPLPLEEVGVLRLDKFLTIFQILIKSLAKRQGFILWVSNSIAYRNLTSDEFLLVYKEESFNTTDMGDLHLRIDRHIGIMEADRS